VRPVDDLVELYFTSVGRNGKLLLNVPPTRDGVLHAVDVARLTKFREARQRLFDEDVAIDAHRKELPNGSLTYTLPREQSIGVVRLGEDIERGQRVSRFTVEGAGGSGPWRTLANGTTIGYARLLRFDPTMLTRVRVRVDEALGANASISAQLFTG
jgi:alpha-L-fucosidase